jgi:hypothetical protein
LFHNLAESGLLGHGAHDAVAVVLDFTAMAIADIT